MALHLRRLVTLVVVAMLAGVAASGLDAQQTAAPPAQGQTATTPAPAAPAPTTPPAQTPDRLAFTAALGTSNPEARLAAFDKFRTDFPTSTLIGQADSQTLLTLAGSFATRTDEMGQVLDRIIARIPASASPELRLTSTIAAVGTLVTRKLMLDRAEKLVGDALAECKDEAPAATSARGRGFEALARIQVAKGNTARAEELYRDAVKANPALMTAVTPLVDMYKARGDNAAIETVLKAAIKGSATPAASVSPTMLLADFYSKKSDFAGAETVLKETIANVKAAPAPTPPAAAPAPPAGAATPPAAAATPPAGAAPSPAAPPAPSAAVANAMINQLSVALADVYIKKGSPADLTAADTLLADILKTNATLNPALVAQAKLEDKRGNTAVALDKYMAVAISGALRGADYDGFVALYSKTNGGVAGLDDKLDTLYRAKYPNPVKVEHWTASPARTKRLVLLELFTGSGCPPCVASDLAFEALMERYPAADIIPLAYHEHIPQPDPMTTTETNARRLYYNVTGVPTFEIDGAMVTSGSGGNRGGGNREGAPALFNLYTSLIDKQLEAAPVGAVTVQATGEGDQVTVTATVADLPADAKDLRLHLILAERELRFGGENGIRFHPMVVRGVAGENAAGLPVSGSATLKHTFNLAAIRADMTKSLADDIARRREASPTATFAAEGRAMTAINTSELVVVAYVQSTDKKVLQSVKTDVVFAGPSKK